MPKKPKRPVETIGKSKKLSEKLKISTPRAPRAGNKAKNTEPRVCGNGKPMPSLAELERMFDDSDDDEHLPTAPALPVPDRCKTPDQPMPEEKKLTPKTLQKLSNKMLDIISNLPDPTILIEDGGPPPPVVPQTRKRKKNGIPYIVGCKERPKVVSKPKCTIGKGDEKYGVNYNIKLEEEDDDCPTKRKKPGIGNPTYSIFNPLAEEIAAKLREAEKNEIHSDGSVDSNKTVTYEYSSLSPNSKARSFSPLPSTSKDNETFIKNDIRLNESLIVDSNSNESSQSEVEIIEMPCETVIVDDARPDETFIVDDARPDEPVLVTAPDVEEVKHVPRAPTFDSFIDLDLYEYSSIVDVDQTFANDDCEIIDVDDVIAGNKVLINKYKASKSSSITHVQPNDVSVVEQQPTKIDLVQTTDPKKTKKETVESVVKDFFKRHSLGNTYDLKDLDPSTNISLEGIDISKELMDLTERDTFNDQNPPSLITIAKIIASNMIQSSRKKTRVIDTITLTDLDHNYTSVSNINDSVTYISTSVPDNRVCYQPENRTNFNSVIIDNNAAAASAPNTNITATETYSVKKKPRKKKDKVIAASVVTPESPKTRRIGDCPICMENLSNTTVASTICGHIFCMPCLKGAIKASGKKCPTCRKMLRGASGYHQLFL